LSRWFALVGAFCSIRGVSLLLLGEPWRPSGGAVDHCPKEEEEEGGGGGGNSIASIGFGITEVGEIGSCTNGVL
jgi:hypothetical protein